MRNIIYWVSMMHDGQRTMIFTHDRSLATMLFKVDCTIVDVYVYQISQQSVKLPFNVDFSHILALCIL